MSYYEEPWDRPPPDLTTRQAHRTFRRMDLDRSLPALLAVEGWHFRAWEPWDKGNGADPYYLYAPDGTLVARWDTEPSLTDLYDCWRQYSSVLAKGGAGD